MLILNCLKIGEHSAFCWDTPSRLQGNNTDNNIINTKSHFKMNAQMLLSTAHHAALLSWLQFPPELEEEEKSPQTSEILNYTQIVKDKKKSALLQERKI